MYMLYIGAIKRAFLKRRAAFVCCGAKVQNLTRRARNGNIPSAGSEAASGPQLVGFSPFWVCGGCLKILWMVAKSISHQEMKPRICIFTRESNQSFGFLRRRRISSIHSRGPLLRWFHRTKSKLPGGIGPQSGETCVKIGGPTQMSSLPGWMAQKKSTLFVCH